MPFIIIISVLLGMALTYAFLNPSERIQATETRELETLDSGYGTNIERFLSESNINSTVVERYFYLKHKYKLTKNTKK